MCIFLSEDDPPDAMPFAYTIGNHEKRLPELLTIGTPDAGFLNPLSEVMIARGKPFADGEIVSIDGKFPVKIINDQRACASTSPFRRGYRRF
jgi:hypothetical protein